MTFTDSFWFGNYIVSLRLLGQVGLHQLMGNWDWPSEPVDSRLNVTALLNSRPKEISQYMHGRLHIVIFMNPAIICIPSWMNCCIQANGIVLFLQRNIKMLSNQITSFQPEMLLNIFLRIVLTALKILLIHVVLYINHFRELGSPGAFFRQHKQMLFIAWYPKTKDFSSASVSKASTTGSYSLCIYLSVWFYKMLLIL